MNTFTTGASTRINIEDCKFDITAGELEIDYVRIYTPDEEPVTG